MKIINKFLNYQKEDSLIRDGFILFVATMFGNLAAFFYHFYMGRILGPEDYGVLGVILSIAYLFNVPASVIQTTIAKFTTQYSVKKQEGKIYSLYSLLLKKFFIYSVIVCSIFLISSYFISIFLKIPILSLIVFSPFILFAFLIPILRGLFQGKQNFKLLGLNISLEALFKLFFGIILVYLGFHIYGAVAAISIASAFAFFLMFFKVKFNKKVDSTVDLKSFYKYLIPVFLALILLTLSYTVDLFFVKHYFSDKEAGLYAALSLLGKIIFFASSAISSVMFPKVASLYLKGKESKYILNKSIIFICLIGIPAVLFYFFFPSIVISILLGSKYLDIAPYLWLFGVVMLLFSLNYLLVFYNLSLNKRKFLLPLFFWFLIECGLLYLFHSSIYTIVIELILLNGVLLVYLLSYTYLLTKDN